ncbi:hypothetical protein ACFQ4O_06390 [Methylopila musalis]|uniref:Lectin-like protein BA14k n=1 Tax=Methylopila musalis TaxID=1134781 RepID=A0ABW3Z625_9HYPH
MTSVRNALLAGACALGMTFGALPAEAAPATRAPATVAGVPMSQIQTVDHRGGHWRGGGRSWGGGGRHWGGGRHYGGGRHWRGGRGYYSGGYYGGRHYGYRRHRDRGGYLAAGALGLAAGAIIAGNSYNSYDRPYYSGGYYRPYRGDGYYRRAYYGSECKVIKTRRDYYGRRYTTVRYRPC